MNGENSAEVHEEVSNVPFFVLRHNPHRSNESVKGYLVFFQASHRCKTDLIIDHNKRPQSFDTEEKLDSLRVMHRRNGFARV